MSRRRSARAADIRWRRSHKKVGRELTEPLLRCAECGAPATVVSGEELEIESIDVIERAVLGDAF
jgi:Zn finger protein HypA/HybF involved in hydrogenase expression